MAVHFNHTVVSSRDKQVSAEFLAHILGLKVGRQWGPFLPVELGNGVTLDFATSDQETITGHHYAFLVGDEEFDEIFERIKEAGITYYADPRLSRPDEINHNDGGRGFYFLDPDRHGMEVITVPYGGW